jgi:ribonuclease J
VPLDTADGDDMADVIFDAIEGTFASIPAARRKDPDLIREAVRRSVRAAVANEWGKRPIVKVLMHVIDVKAGK